jgi:hypothetical protein
MKPTTEYPQQTTQILEHLSDPDTAIRFFQQTNIAQVDKIQSIQRYARADGRKGIVLTVKEAGQSDLTRIAIDVKYGQPNTDQLVEVLYIAGADCDIRIILHTGIVEGLDLDEDNPSADLYLLQYMVRDYNEYSLNLYLVRVSFPEFEGCSPDFDVEAQPQEPPKHTLNDLPTERTFRESEFWAIIVDSIDPGFYENWKPETGNSACSSGLGNSLTLGMCRLGKARTVSRHLSR